MPTSDRIWITGYGITTCLGMGVEENWRCLAAGEPRLGPVTRFPLGDHPVRRGGEAPAAPEGDEELPNEIRHVLRASREALGRAGYEAQRFPEGGRTALVVGSSLAGSSVGERFFADYLERGPAGARYELLGGYYVESQLDALCRELGIDGTATLVSNACAAGGASLARGAGLLRLGRADRALCAGYDPLSIFTFAGFGSLLALTASEVRPFAKGRDGMLLGDGYAACVLERLSDDEARERCLCTFLAGYGESADAHHLTHPHPQGSGAALAMRRALARAEVAPQEVGYINCHGTATRPNDAAESRAMKEVFGAALGGIPVSSSKPFFGHTLGGAGTVEAVVTILALERGFLPANLNLDELDPDCAGLDVLAAGRPAAARYALSNSFGFGGANASLLFGREAWS